MGGADPGAAGFSIATFTANVPAARIDDAVRRVLRLKFRLGVFENPYGDPVNGPYRFHTPAYTALANQAARKAMTLLKNDRRAADAAEPGRQHRGGRPAGDRRRRLLRLDELLPPGVRLAEHPRRDPGAGGARPG